MRLGQLNDRLNRLTDAYLDQALDKEMFEQRKQSLLLDRKATEEHLADLNQEKKPFPDKAEKFLELANTALLSYQIASPEEKREMVRIVTSNRHVKGKNVELEPSIAFREISNRPKEVNGCPYRAEPRTFDQILENLTTLNTNGQLPDLSSLGRVRDNDSGEENTNKRSEFAE
jgi:hypothetical protein